MTLRAGDPLPYWQTTPMIEAPYDVPDSPMQGEMDSTFFLTKDKNYIPHTYPCRTAYIAAFRDKEPVPGFAPDWAAAQNILPMGAAFLDLSGFWFRATRLCNWQRTAVHAAAAGPARLRLGICGAAKLFVNGQAVGWLAPTIRNAMTKAEFDVTLREGHNEIAVWQEDLAERDAVIRILVEWVAGPAARAARPYGVDDALVDGVERAIAAMHLDRKHYDDPDMIRLILPRAFPQAARASVVVSGHFMSHDSQGVALAIPQGATAVEIGRAGDFPADYRYFHFDLDCGGFRTRATLGAEISWRSRSGAAPDTQAARIAEALAWIAAHAESDTETALACLDQNATERAAAIYRAELPGIEACFDCADFALVPMLWGRIVYGDRIPADLRNRMDAAVRDFRYWMDEPGNDVQWYFSENHALLFHTAAYLAGMYQAGATFRRSGRTGAEQHRVGYARLCDWFDHFERAEMAEFNSSPYFPIDLKGMTALYALAPDDDIRDRARRAILRLIEIVANSAHHGVNTAAEGRSYEHSLCPADTSELTGMARLLWGRGWFGAHVNCLSQLAICLRDHGLAVDPALKDRALWTGAGEQEWRFAQGNALFARLYHYKTADVAMGSTAAYRWGEWGYQETLIHGRLGDEPRAQFWINHPGEMVQSGYGRPSYWGGSASVPRVQQYRGLALVAFSGTEGHLGFTHAWFPTEAFQDWHVAGTRARARHGRGCVALRGNGPLTLMTEGGSAHAELRLAGLTGLWLVRLGSGDDAAAFEAAHPLQAVADGAGSFTVMDPDYGSVRFLADGRIEAEGRVLAPLDWTLEGERLSPTR
ncbi:hypothetical protein KM031_18255 (plasmid) [Gemmobacter fulvus]|uniref:Uncharacterized protein n=1 Tax=Gemmobacter fulvus TaxID=2840474 RepID=A0A975P9Z3_9RHOB|nr:hypothetical protein [Gemmobacter fulvus]MBT9245995.1 hypothetical protein [Gemmobacter fulvus]QWK92235.1 hypothetical protein KM031_18255 [Gemmobacter fulvus]